MSSVPSLTELRDFHAEGSARIQHAFESHRDGLTALRARTALIESLVGRLWQQLITPETSASACLVAVGGFGRAALFPYSDVDLLFLCAAPAAEQIARPGIRAFSQRMWDLHLRLSPATRTLAECDRLDRRNVEFTIAMLDCRYLAGSAELFTRLHDGMLPRLVARERQALLQALVNLAQRRYARFGNTIFHLEPNLKDGPGGLRDYHLACWISLIAFLERERAWPRDRQDLLPGPARDECSRAVQFLSAARCFLHYRSGRDENSLSWEDQDEAAAAGVGLETPVQSGEWMRAYFRHARVISNITAQLLDEVPPARSSLYQQYQNWRSRLSNADFSVSGGRIYLQQASARQDPALILRAFEFMARHGFKLSRDTEQRIQRTLGPLAASPPQGDALWQAFRSILTLPHAAQSLRAMHALGLLVVLLPEFDGIADLVIRDFYHRYTVDEHSFIAVHALHQLRQAENETEQRFAGLLAEIVEPELLFLAVLLHDLGKGAPSGPHVEAGMPLVQSVLARFALCGREQELVRFLVAHHLEIPMSLLRRDIFDSQTADALAKLVGTTERLKMLILLSYADLKAVNPGALTPWKADNMWQLYMASANRLDHRVDDERLAPALPAFDSKFSPFLDGLPRRYLLMHSPEEVALHFEMAARLICDSVQLDLRRRRQLHQLTVVTPDRPGLFACIAGVLSAWGMDIVKADVFTNNAGVVVDTFLFADPFRTLELNPPECERFKRSVAAAVARETDPDKLVEARLRARLRRPTRPAEEARIAFENDSSPRRTVLELVAANRPGLLYAVASVLARKQCNIELALIDTEGQTAIDVFYITVEGAKLDFQRQQQLRKALLETLAEAD